MGLRQRLDSIRPVVPSALAVEATLAVLPYAAAILVVASGGVVFGSLTASVSPSGASGASGVVFGSLVVAALAVVGLCVALLAHGLVDLGRLVRGGLPESPDARAVAHGVVRGVETLLAVGFLLFAVRLAGAFVGSVPSPAGVSLTFAFAAGYLVLSGVVVAHAAGRALVGLAAQR